MSDKVSYPIRVAIAFDVFINVILNGNQDETISSRAGRAAHKRKLWGILLSNTLNYFFPNHCKMAELHDKWRAEYVVWLESQQ